MKNLLSIVRSNSDDKDFIELIRWLDAELNERNGVSQADYNKFNIIQSLGTVVIAYIDGHPAGCGCFKKYDDNTVEMKRMFVKPEYRGRGISTMILTELEKWAQELGFTKVILETGVKQTEAIRLYQKRGYSRIDNYDQYIGMKDSVCFGKNIKI